MKSECQEVSSIERSLSVTIDGDVVLKELSRAYSKLNQRVRIDGFRKGKVPRQVLERHYKQEVENEVLAQVISKAYGEALDEHGVHPVAQPEIRNSEFIPGQDVAFTAKVEVRPVIELKKFSGFEIEKTSRAIDEEEIEKELEQLRQRHSKVEPVEGRTLIKKGDLVVVNFHATVDGEGFKGGEGNGYVMDTGEPNFIPAVLDALVGRTVAEKFEVDGELPSTFHNKDVAGKVAHFELTPIQIKCKQLPDLDDEFAKDLGDFDDLNALRAKIRNEVQKRTEEEDEDNYQNALVDALIEANPFDVPPSLVKRQADVIIYQTFGQTPPERLAAMGVDLDGMRKELAPQAEKRVRRGMLLETIADAEKVEVTDEDVDSRIREVAERVSQPVEKLRGLYKGERNEELRFSIRLEKALDIVKNGVGTADAKGSKRSTKATAAEGAPA